MPRIFGFASFFLFVLGGRSAGATTVAQDCSGVAFFASAIVVTGSALYDIGTAPASARLRPASRARALPKVAAPPPSPVERRFRAAARATR